MGRLVFREMNRRSETVLRANCRCASPLDAVRWLAIAVCVSLAMAVSAVWAVIPADALLAKLEPQGYVSDFAGVLNPGQRAALEGRLAELDRKSGAQGAVAIL